MQANRVRILAVTSKDKSALFPKLPTVAEAGVLGYEYELWWGIFAPAGLSAERVNFINAAINKIVGGPDMKKFLDSQGAEPWVMTTTQMTDLLPKEIARYKKASQIAGIQEQ